MTDVAIDFDPPGIAGAACFGAGFGAAFAGGRRSGTALAFLVSATGSGLLSAAVERFAFLRATGFERVFRGVVVGDSSLVTALFTAVFFAAAFLVAAFFRTTFFFRGVVPALAASAAEPVSVELSANVLPRGRSEAANFTV